MYQCLLIDSEYGSMGRWISLIVGDVVGMKLYEGKDLVALAGEPWLTREYLRSYDDTLKGMSLEEVKSNPEQEHLHTALARAIRTAVEKGPCIIHERAASEVLKDVKCLRVFLGSSNLENKVARARTDPKFDLKNVSYEEVVRVMADEDRKRKLYRDAVAEERWGEKESYDLYLDSDSLGRERCARILIEALQDKMLDVERCEEVIAKAQLD